MEKDIIAELHEMNAKEFMEKTGMMQEYQQKRKEVQELNELTGEAREEAVAAVERKMSPDLHGLSWVKEDAIRKAKKKNGEVHEVCCD